MTTRILRRLGAMMVLTLFHCGSDPKKEAEEAAKKVATEAEGDKTYAGLQKLATENTTKYDATAATFRTDFWRSEFKYQVSDKRSSDTIYFADQTVYMGHTLEWFALVGLGDLTATQPITDIKNLMDGMLTHLDPNSTGYFVRDTLTETTLTVDGKSYTVKSDGNHETVTNKQQSLDQIVHMLSGYFLGSIYLDKQGSDAAKTQLTRIKDHAHVIGTRLKANNYIVKDLQNANVVRGPDARVFAYPIAATISRITGKSIDTYLESVQTITGQASTAISRADLKGTFSGVLDAISTNVCEIKFGSENKQVCQRFVLSMVNYLYYTSGFYSDVPAYIVQMDIARAYYQALMARRLRGDSEVLAAYGELLKAGESESFTPAAKTFCQDFYWVRLPDSNKCPESDSTKRYTGLDFMLLHQLAKSGDKIPEM